MITLHELKIGKSLLRPFSANDVRLKQAWMEQHEGDLIDMAIELARVEKVKEDKKKEEK